MIQSKYTKLLEDSNNTYFTIPTDPAIGVLYVTQNNLEFISGHVRMSGRSNGSYPYKYLEMIDSLFGEEDNTIEVCSGMMRKDSFKSKFTVDINPKTEPDIVDDGQILSSIPNARFSRWRCDPPYNPNTAKKMYGSRLPSPIKLLKPGSRVCKVGSLMFLLLGPKNYEWHPKGVKRIGCVLITAVPNNEFRGSEYILQIYGMRLMRFRIGAVW